MRKFGVLWGGILAARILAPWATFGGALDMDEVFARSVVDRGNTIRLEHVFEKARAGGPIVVGTIGGSITMGTAASKPERRWANLVADWWAEEFPQCPATLVNAGIGATGSLFGAHRVKGDLLESRPDFVVVEFAVNDSPDLLHAEALEGLVRQILRCPSRPAVLLLFTMNMVGANAQAWHEKVGRHYGLPMISYRDALWPEIEAGRLAWEDISPDEVHPNDRGHAYCAEFINRYLAEILRKTAADGDGTLREIPPLPEPLFTDLFEYTRRLPAADLEVASNEGWILDAEKGWTTDRAGDEIVFRVPGDFMAMRFYRIRGDMGIAEVRIDGGEPVKLNAWFAPKWGGYVPSEVIGRRLGPGVHEVRVRVLEETAPQSRGHRFEIREILCAGKQQ